VRAFNKIIYYSTLLTRKQTTHAQGANLAAQKFHIVFLQSEPADFPRERRDDHFIIANFIAGQRANFKIISQLFNKRDKRLGDGSLSSEFDQIDLGLLKCKCF